MSRPANSSPEAENRHHSYVTHDLPWFVHVLWISFWAFAIYYTLRYILPAIRSEWLSPP
ncbi:MAG: hypothetical protein NZM31_11205 [Gemmatales bacterium]|nr:hypothetical protein [Gemmatales bacterium]MDW8387564.1 hypothetical protein [Gemmatales bacterium]